MIEAQELRIGNWINSSAHFGEIQVSAILKDGVNPFDWGQGNHCIHFYDTIAPIKITEEWLINFGFESFDLRFRHLGNFVIHNEGENFFYKTRTTEIKIKHVHQLQNLYFALTGEELTGSI